MLTFDTLWYHGPFAARIAESGSAWGLHFTDPLYLNWFYPQDSELLHGAGISLFDRDILSPFVNFGWLGISLLAAWCIGRPYGVAPLTLVAVALTLDIGPMVPREAGTPANDVAPVAMLLAAGAVLVNAAAQARAKSGAARTFHSGGPPLADVIPMGAILVAGLAMGLALGTKLTIAGGLAAMAVGLPLVLPAGIRRKALLVFLGGVTATAGFWFLRNLIHSGTPLPWAQELGPIDLPGPDRGLEGRDNYNVAHYIFETPDTGHLERLLLQGDHEPVRAAVVRDVRRGRRRGGARDRPAADADRAPARGRHRRRRRSSTCSPRSRRPARRTSRSRSGSTCATWCRPWRSGSPWCPLEPKLTPERARLPLLVGGALALLITSLYSDSAYIWSEPFASIPVAALIGIAFIGIPVGLALLGRRSAALAAAAGAAAALIVGGVGWERSDDYLDARYTEAEDLRFQLDDAAAWAKDTSDERIGVAGLSGAYNQYILYGDELSNHVQYLGRNLSAGDFRAIEKCPEFIREVNEGDYSYVVTTPELDLNDPDTAKVSPEGGWMRGAGAEEVLRTGRVSIFRIDGELSPRLRSEGAGRR